MFPECSLGQRKEKRISNAGFLINNQALEEEQAQFGKDLEFESKSCEHWRDDAAETSTARESSLNSSKEEEPTKRKNHLLSNGLESTVSKKKKNSGF